MISQTTEVQLPAELSSLVELLRWRSNHQPDQRAYTFLSDGETETGHWTYGELDWQARKIAARLQTLIARGERALLLYPQGLDFIAAFFGCLYAGVIAVPAYPPRSNQRLSRLQAIVIDAQAAIALTTTELLASIQLRPGKAQALRDMQWLATDSLTDIQAAGWQPPSALPETLAFLQYTSGSTGTPKGVMVSHSNILHNSEYIRKAFELSSASVSVSWLPSFHDMGLIDGVIQPLYTGFLGVLMPPEAFMQKPIRWLRAISHYGATHCGGPNLGYEICTQKIPVKELQNLDLGTWQSAYSGAEPVRQKTLKNFASKFSPCGFLPRFFYPCYGMAESTLMVSGGNVNANPFYCTVKAEELEQNRVREIQPEDQGISLVGCGYSRLNTQIMIVDPETRLPCASDQIGEIWVAGASVAKGYWQRPEQTEATFKAYLANSQDGPYLRTGDLGFLRGEELFITGRLKDLIILWGRNHYPQDIELNVSQSHPALRPECGAAFSMEVDGVERLVVVQEVERTYLRNLNVGEITTAIRQAIAEQHDLSVAVIALLKTASIPKTSSGKIQRYACRKGLIVGDLNIVGEWRLSTNPSRLEVVNPPKAVENLEEKTRYQDSVEETSDKEEPSDVDTVSEDSIQDWLIERLATISQVDPDEIDIEAPFSSYGLDSSVAMSLTGELADWLGCNLEPTLFWEYPNIAEMTQYLFHKTQSLTGHHG